MKKSRIFILAAASLVFLSSCNKGVGCPNNFSLDAEHVEQFMSILSYLLG